MSILSLFNFWFDFLILDIISLINFLYMILCNLQIYKYTSRLIFNVSFQTKL